MPHFENMDAYRGPPVLSRDSALRAFGQRDGLAWEHLELIRSRWPGHLVVKGVMSPEDARIARESGVDGVIVSNHGGRQLDGTVSPLRVLPAIAAEARGMAVMLDGGVRRGTDVLKALALGAQFVFIGRPFICAAAVRGEPGRAARHHPALGGDPAEHGHARHQRSRADAAGVPDALARRLTERRAGAWR